VSWPAPEVWDALSRPVDIDELAAALRTRFETAPTLADDLPGLLVELTEHGLVEVLP